MTPEPVDGDGVRLRTFALDDLDDLVAAFADRMTTRALVDLPNPYTRADAHRWVTEQAPALWRAGGVTYAITDPGTGRLLGGIVLNRPIVHRHQAEVGYWVAPWARRQGVGTAPANLAAQRVLERVGFRREGLMRGRLPDPTGGRTDTLLFGLLPTDLVERPH